MANGGSIGEIRKKITKTYEFISTAYHEAGHTIFALLSGMKVSSVYIFEHKLYKRIHGFTQYQSQDLDPNNVQFTTLVQQEIGLSYAGLLSEKYHFKNISGSDQIPMFIKEGSRNDLLEIGKLVRKYELAPPGKQRRQYKQKISQHTLSILLQHWDAVELIAHSLFKHKKLSYHDLRELLTKKSNNKKFWKEQFKIISQNFPD